MFDFWRKMICKANDCKDRKPFLEFFFPRFVFNEVNIQKQNLDGKKKLAAHNL
jgi:hypothetical protein